MVDDLITRAVTSAPTSIDPAARTATFTVISASNDAPRADAAGPYVERLDPAPPSPSASESRR